METMEKRSTSFKILASKPDEGGAIQAIIAEDRDAELSAAKKVLHVAGHVLLIDRGESIVVGSVSGGVDDGAVQWRRLACLGVRPVADMCRFLSSSRILVVVTAAGEAIRVDWTNDTVLGPIDELRYVIFLISPSITHLQDPCIDLENNRVARRSPTNLFRPASARRFASAAAATTTSCSWTAPDRLGHGEKDPRLGE